MPKEKETYRNNYEALLETFPGKNVLGIKEIQQYTGWGRTRVIKNVPLKEHKWITVASFAQYLSV